MPSSVAINSANTHNERYNYKNVMLSLYRILSHYEKSEDERGSILCLDVVFDKERISRDQLSTDLHCVSLSRKFLKTFCRKYLCIQTAKK